LIVVSDAGTDTDTDFYFDAASGKLTGVTYFVASGKAQTSCLAGGSDFSVDDGLRQRDVEVNLCCPSATYENHYVCQ
jgi:hypothetical protein